MYVIRLLEIVTECHSLFSAETIPVPLPNVINDTLAILY